MRIRTFLFLSILFSICYGMAACDAALQYIKIAPTSYDYGFVDSGMTPAPSADFVVQNITTNSLQIDDVSLGGADMAEFEITAGGVTPFDIPAGDSAQMHSKEIGSTQYMICVEDVCAL